MRRRLRAHVELTRNEERCGGGRMIPRLAATCRLRTQTHRRNGSLRSGMPHSNLSGFRERKARRRLREEVPLRTLFQSAVYANRRPLHSVLLVLLLSRLPAPPGPHLRPGHPRFRPQAPVSTTVKELTQRRSPDPSRPECSIHPAAGACCYRRPRALAKLTWTRCFRRGASNPTKQQDRSR
jgi:hypothetical protein